jgi:hypothetical protein
MGIAKDKLTEEQKREVERLRQFVSRNRFTVRMNSTKWRAAIDAVMAIPEIGQPEYKVKLITDLADPAPGRWTPGFPAGLPLYNAIEWVELRTKVVGAWDASTQSKGKDFGPAIRKALEAAEIPHEDGMEGIRIIGHSREKR